MLAHSHNNNNSIIHTYNWSANTHIASVDQFKLSFSSLVAGQYLLKTGPKLCPLEGPHAEGGFREKCTGNLKMYIKN